MAKLVRAKPKKVDVRVEVLGQEEAMIEVSTKGLQSVADLGERLAEEMVTTLNIEDAFKLYYIDNEGDTMLVSAHTALRDLIYSELITAKVDDYALPAPPAETTPPKKGRNGRGRTQEESDEEEEEEEEEESAGLRSKGGKKNGKKSDKKSSSKKRGGGAPRSAPAWDS